MLPSWNISFGHSQWSTKAIPDYSKESHVYMLSDVQANANWIKS